MKTWAAALLVWIAAAAASFAAEVSLSIAGMEPEPVTLHRRDACATSDVPDTAARAWRDADGRVHLVATHWTARRLSGPALDHLRPDCAIVFRPGLSTDPAAHDDHGWIAATYSPDGRTVHALVHNEFHGQRRPDLCPSARYSACWANDITARVSIDGGRTFGPPAGRALVAGLPYRFRGDLGRRQGLFQPSNIVAWQGHYYAFVWAEALDAQKRGACLIRTHDLADAAAWRGFDGRDFSIRFVDPYREAPADPAAHVCAPVAPDRLATTVWSIVRHEAAGRWIAILAASRSPVPGAAARTGFWYATSANLLDWTPPRLLWEAPLLTHPDCGGKTSFYYPALLDPGSGSRNFETVGDHAFLYLTRLNLTDCRPTWDRDLVRLPVRITATN